MRRARGSSVVRGDLVCGVLSLVGLGDGVRGGLVLILGGNPCAAVGGELFLPERCAGFQIVHQELGRREGISPVRRGGRHHHDLVLRPQPSVAMDDQRILDLDHCLTAPGRYLIRKGKLGLAYLRLDP